MMSLKDQQNGQPQVEERISAVNTNSTEPSEKGNPAASSTESCGSSMDAPSMPEDNGQKSAMQDKTSDTSTLPVQRSHPTVTEPESSRASTQSDASGSSKSSSAQCTSDADVSDSTKATLTVERNPSSNLMEGLIRRWDFNFFRNSR